MMIKSATAMYLAFAVGVVGVVAGTQLSEQAPTSAQAQTSSSTPADRTITGDINAGTFRDIAAEQMPTVVSLSTLTRSERPAAFDDPLFRQFFGGPAEPAERLLQGAGTGFVMDKSGLVLTNAHVVQDAERIEVVLFSDPSAGSTETRRYPARVLGRDPLTDSALLQVEGAPDLPVATLGNSDAMRPGDWVVAIGNPFALSHTVTVGVVSATSRPFPLEGRQQRVLQTDAAVNPGNSGGPLLNLRGEVVGINTAIVPGSGGTNVGVGFAVPINLVRDLIPQLRQGDVQHGRLGVQVRDVPTDARSALGLGENAGVLVVSVEAGGPAAAAQLKPGDVILSVDGETMDNAEELVQTIGATKPGAQKRLVIMRNGARQEIGVTLDQLTTGTTSASRTPATEEELGLTLSALTAEMTRRAGLSAGQAGAVVTRVRPVSPAAEAGVQPGDIILEVNRQAVGSLDDTLSRVRRSVGAQEATLLLVLRDGQRLFLVVGKPGA